MKDFLGLSLVLVFALASASASSEGSRHLYLCSSPLVAFDFWRGLQGVQEKGVKGSYRITSDQHSELVSDPGEALLLTVPSCFLEPIWSRCLTKGARKSCARYWTTGGVRRHKICCTRWL